MLDLAPLGDTLGIVYIIIAAWFVSIVADGYIAHESARLPVKWIVWAVLAGPLAVIVLLVNVRRDTYGTTSHRR